jgi:hypothetical protein
LRLGTRDDFDAKGARGRNPETSFLGGAAEAADVDQCAQQLVPDVGVVCLHATQAQRAFEAGDGGAFRAVSRRGASRGVQLGLRGVERLAAGLLAGAQLCGIAFERGALGGQAGEDAVEVGAREGDGSGWDQELLVEEGEVLARPPASATASRCARSSSSIRSEQGAGPRTRSRPRFSR